MSVISPSLRQSPIMGTPEPQGQNGVEQSGTSGVGAISTSAKAQLSAASPLPSASRSQAAEPPPLAAGAGALVDGYLSSKSQSGVANLLAANQASNASAAQANQTVASYLGVEAGQTSIHGMSQVAGAESERVADEPAEPAVTQSVANYQFSGIVGDTAAVVSGGLKAGAKVVDHTGRNLTADIMTKGNAGHFKDVPPGHANRQAFADDVLRSGKKTAEQALDGLPFGKTAKSTRALAGAAKTAGKLSKVAGPIGNFVGPIADTTEAVLNAKPGDELRSGVIGAISSLDDVAAGALGGAVGGAAGTLAAGPGLGTGLGAAAGSTVASGWYDGSDWDKAFDDLVNDAVRAFTD